MNMLERARALQEQLTAWRREFHMHPELGFEEHRTAKRVAEELEKMGLRVQTGVGKTGVVGTIGQGSPVVGIRADMDALPLQEENDAPYASQTPGKMHACGHDTHVAMLLGTARLLNEMDDRPSGEIRLLFQPCEETQDEEGKGGALRMIEAGALDGVDTVIALHVASDIPTGQLQIIDGYTSASTDSFYITIKGEGCHGAYPHKGVDPVFILAQVINAIHSIRARRINPVRPAVISIGGVHGGTVANIIPETVELNGTIRSYDDETRARVKDELKKTLTVCRALGGDYVLEIQEGVPSTNNDPRVAEVIRQVARDLLGPKSLYPPEPGMGGEDFSYMTRKAPGAMFHLGAQIGQEHRPGHSPFFDVDESAFPIGAALLAESACRLLKNAPK